MKNKNGMGDVPEIKKYVTLGGCGEDEFEEKKSVFIGHAAHVTTEEAAKSFIADIKKQYSDASHNCWAYFIGDGNTARFSDDGEPQGTAGLPILNIIKSSGITDAAVVVTRYFGGILLGTGGLARAYTEGARIAVAAAGIVEYELYDEIVIVCSYSDYQRLQYEMPKYGVKVDDTVFGGDVTVTAAVKRTLSCEFEARIAEMGSGKMSFIRRGVRYDA